MAAGSSHLVPLGTGSWSLWRWVWLRGAGFPARQILELGSDALVAQLDAEDAAKARADSAQRAAIDVCLVAAARPAVTQAIKTALSRLRARRLPPATGSAEVDAAIDAYRIARTVLSASGERSFEVVKAA